MSDNKFIIELSSSEINTIAKAISCYEDINFRDIGICFDENFEPYYFDDKGNIISDKSDLIIKEHEDIININSKLWMLARSNNS